METAKIEDDEANILAVTRQLTQFMIDKNTAGISKIVDADFTLTHITGFVQSKEDWLDEIDIERMKYHSCTEVRTSLEICLDKAFFSGQNVLDAFIWGTRNNWRLQQNMQLEKRNGKWIILKSIATIF